MHQLSKKITLSEDYTIGAASYFETNVLFRLKFVTMMDLCFKKF